MFPFTVDLVNRLQEQKAEAHLLISPNPSAGEVFLSWPAVPAVSLSIYNIMGKKVHETGMNGVAFSYRWQPQGAAAGLYYCHLQLANGQSMQGTVVLK